jgi:GT2 family glycosyltransferase
MQMLPSVDIVILNYNGRKFIDECIQTVQQSTYSNKHIYVLDNASTHDDVAYIIANYPAVKIIQNPNNNGYCAAYNLALQFCTGDYIICLNNDVAVAPNWIESMVELAESDESIAAIQPKLLSYFDETEFEYAGASGGKMDVYGFPFLRGRVFDSIEKDHQQYDNITQIFWASGAALFMRKSALKYSGFFDETIVHHMDEIDLCWRLRMAGYKLFVQPKSVIKHIGGATIQTKSFKKIYWNHRNSIYIMLKNYNSKHAWSFVPVHVLLDYVAVAYAIISLNFVMAAGILSAHFWLLSNLFLIRSKRKETQAMRKVGDEKILPFLYRKSVVIEYFFKRNKTYSTLTNIDLHENINH